jgi:SOS-response transcriptional repressor LexA
MNEQKFLALYQRQQESGLTIKEFCSNEALAPATFHYWKKKLGSQNRLPGFIPLVVNTSVSTTKGNYPCQSDLLPHETQNQECPLMEVEFPNKTIVRIKSGLDLNMLKALIHLSE